MADLAGFDVIGEVHIETVVDFLNLSPVVNPIDGKSIYLFGGPFSTDLNVTVGEPIGTISVRLIVSAELEPVVRQPLAKVIASFKGGASVSSVRGLNDIGGQVTVSVPLSFALPAGASTTAQHVPVFEFAAVAPEVELDTLTRGFADAALGAGGADRLTTGLRDAFATLLFRAGSVAIPAFGFTVVPGIDSHDPTQLSALPTVAWIDNETLAVFGYYRAAASAGNIAAKPTGDLATVHEEFFYNQPGLYSTVPGRRLALLMSAEAFEMVIACPAVRNKVVRALVFQREKASWVNWERSQNGGTISQQMNARLVQHYLEEEQKDPGQSPQTYFDRAKGDVQADIDNAIDALATSEENAWLGSPSTAGPESTPGQQAIDQAVPPPCGNGSVQIARIPVEHAQSDLLPMLRRLKIALAEGNIAVNYDVGGMLEVIAGDVTFDVHGELDIALTVTDSGQLGVNVTSQPPIPAISASGLTGTITALLKGLFDGFWHDLMLFLGLILQGQITKAIKNAGFPEVIPLNTPQQPFPNRLVEVTIDPDSLFVAVLICREPRWNDFNPSLLIDSSRDSRTEAAIPPVHGKIVLPATEWGCQAAEFETTRTFFDETWTVRARLRDAPLPVTFLDWQIELGNFSWNTIGGFHFLDPRPTWSNQPVEMRYGVLTLDGEVEHLDPLMLPYIDGPLTPAQVPITVTGDADNGWQISLRGTDGNYYLRFATDAIDGDGKQWHAETFISHTGDQLALPPEYTAYKTDCDAKHAKWWRLRLDSLHLVGIGDVQPGQPVMNGETREAIAVATLINAGDPTALQQLTAAREQYGPSFSRQLGKVAPLQLGTLAPGSQVATGTSRVLE